MTIIDNNHEIIKPNEPTQYVRNNPENEFVKDFMPIIMKLAQKGGRRNVIAVPEVPYSFWSNNQIDMMLLDLDRKDYLLIEFKNSNYNKLVKQVERAGKHCIGILNSHKVLSNHGGFPQGSVYTRNDTYIKHIAGVVRSDSGMWGNRYSDLGYIYYWAYKNEVSSFDGGKLSGGRDNFQAMYCKAIANLLQKHPTLEHSEIYKLFGMCYSHSYSIKIFNEIKKAIKEIK